MEGFWLQVVFLADEGEPEVHAGRDLFVGQPFQKHNPPKYGFVNFVPE
jgi:hypothetical protein